MTKTYKKQTERSYRFELIYKYRISIEIHFFAYRDWNSSKLVRTHCNLYFLQLQVREGGVDTVAFLQTLKSFEQVLLQSQKYL